MLKKHFKEGRRRKNALSENFGYQNYYDPKRLGERIIVNIIRHNALVWSVFGDTNYKIVT